ncbi:MAG: DUF3127 domain-containing protein [Verrucomicrobiota bacterium]
MFEIEGVVKELFEDQTFGSGFRKREFVLTTAGKYPQDIKFECVQDKIGQLEGVSKGDSLSVKFDIRGREWKGNYYVNLNAWQVTSGGGSSEPESNDSVPPVSTAEDPEDDIPF